MPTNKQLAITAFGEPGTLQVVESELPAPGPEQVLVKVAFAAVNPIDAKTRAGIGWAAEQNKDNLPWVPGYDIAGVVVDSGCHEEAFEKGDRVTGLIGFPLGGGAYSQYVAVDASLLSSVPAGVSLATAAALPVCGQTAWQALEKAKLADGEKVLILAGAGGVGHLAVQLAKARHADVYATCSQANCDYLSDLGISVIDYQASGLGNYQAFFDVIIDLVGGETGINALGALNGKGRMITVPTVTKDAVIAEASQRGLHADGMLVSPNRWQMDRLLTMAETDELTVEIANTYSLEKGADAHRDIMTGRTRGKILLEMPQ
ncbi:NADPH:quinone reductase [Veronia nyctiphanis]|uniref:NADPH:quinone reductase n=1 Tax=Veronia nyctiphanis TaxID=1278244 RepID=A0A4Q0YK78_9GAMM|nr:NADP-dependent oxidoreductase [Veronia nyctiphanis]RXJ71036.1 NADPH:quinone reductase [Veronia nyctiphanis]